MVRTDMRVTEDGTDVFINANTGDFDTFASDFQHQMDIIQGSKGSYKEFPGLGVGAQRFISSSSQFIQLRRDVRSNLESDGYKLKEFNIDGNTIDIIADLITNG